MTVCNPNYIEKFVTTPGTQSTGLSSLVGASASSIGAGTPGIEQRGIVVTPGTTTAGLEGSSDELVDEKTFLEMNLELLESEYRRPYLIQQIIQNGSIILEQDLTSPEVQNVIDEINNEITEPGTNGAGFGHTVLSSIWINTLPEDPEGSERLFYETVYIPGPLDVFIPTGLRSSSLIPIPTTRSGDLSISGTENRVDNPNIFDREFQLQQLGDYQQKYKDILKELQEDEVEGRKELIEETYVNPSPKPIFIFLSVSGAFVIFFLFLLVIFSRVYKK